MDPTGQYIRFTLGHEAMAIDSEGRYKVSFFKKVLE